MATEGGLLTLDDVATEDLVFDSNGIYIPQTWSDELTGFTSITPTRLNHIEQGVKGTSESLKTLRDSISQTFIPAIDTLAVIYEDTTYKVYSYTHRFTEKSQSFMLPDIFKTSSNVWFDQGIAVYEVPEGYGFIPIPYYFGSTDFGTVFLQGGLLQLLIKADITLIHADVEIFCRVSK